MAVKNVVNLKLVKAIRQDLLKSITPLFKKQDGRFTGIEQRLDGLEKGQVKLETGLTSLEKNQRSLKDIVLRHGADIVTQKEEILAALDGVTSMLPQKEIVKDLEIRVESLEQNMTVVKTAIRSLTK